jgi:hypothetical protein
LRAVGSAASRLVSKARRNRLQSLTSLSLENYQLQVQDVRGSERSVQSRRRAGVEAMFTPPTFGRPKMPASVPLPASAPATATAAAKSCSWTADSDAGSLPTPQPPKTTALPMLGAHTIEWPDRGVGPAFFTFTLCQETSPSFCAASVAARGAAAGEGGGHGGGPRERGGGREGPPPLETHLGQRHHTRPPTERPSGAPLGTAARCVACVVFVPPPNWRDTVTSTLATLVHEHSSYSNRGACKYFVFVQVCTSALP